MPPFPNEHDYGTTTFSPVTRGSNAKFVGEIFMSRGLGMRPFGVGFSGSWGLLCCPTCLGPVVLTAGQVEPRKHLERRDCNPSHRQRAVIMLPLSPQVKPGSILKGLCTRNIANVVS